MRITSIVRRGLLLGSGLVLLLTASGVPLMWTSRVEAAGLALDKLVTGNQSSSTTTVISPTFTTSQPGELLVAFLTSDGPSGAQTFSSVVNATGGSLTWTLRKRMNTQRGTSEIWTAVAPNVLTNASVRGTHSGNYQASITVATFTGADTSTIGATGGANASTGAPSTSLTTTRNGSWVWGVGNDWDRAVARTVGTGQTKVSEYLAPAGDTFWVQRRTDVAATAGTSVTLNATAPTNDRWNMAAIEILPAAVTEPDTQAPSAPSNMAATATSPNQVQVIWAASTDNVGVAGYTILRDDLQTNTSTGTTYLDGTVLPGATYSYQVYAFDAAGNISSASAVATVTTPVPDTTAPVITDVASDSVGQTSATITWQTDEPSTTQIQYGITEQYGGTTTLASALVIAHSQTIAGLAANTEYHYRVLSKDASNNQTASEDFTFTTLPVPPDTQAPAVALTAPTQGAQVAGVVNVTANASDNTGVVGVQFLLDGVALGVEDTSAPYSTSWNTNTAAAGTHTLAVIARDVAGNATTSTVVTVTVNNSDLLAPSVNITSPAGGATLSGSTTVTANAGDNVGVVGVQFYLDGVVLGSEDTAAPYSVPWSTVSATNGSHQITAVARDAAGNRTTSSVINVTVSNSTGGGTPLTINGNQVYQTMDGFGVNANSASWDDGALRPQIDRLVDENGSTIWRVVIDLADWEAVNDNADPNTFNWDYYTPIFESAKFQDLWEMMAYLNQKGITSNLILSFMGPGPAWMGAGNLPTNMESEWAETVAAVAYYGRTVKGLQFGQFSPNNEPDLDCIEGICMNAAQHGRVMGALATKLDGLGLTDLRLMGPDTAAMSKALDYTQVLFNDPSLMAHIDHLAIHNYDGNLAYSGQSYENLLRNSPYASTKDFWVTEVSQFADAFAHISQGASSVLVWDGYDSIYNHPKLHGGHTDAPNDAGDGPALLSYNAGNDTYAARKEFYQYAQLFKFVPAGSQRVAAVESNGNVTAYAFRHPQSDRVTIVGRNTGSAVTFNSTLANMPAVPAFEFYHTDWSGGVNMQRGSDVAVTNGAFNFTAPANSVFTLTFAGAPDTQAPTAPANVTAANPAPSQAVLGWTAASDNVAVTAYDVYRSSLPSFTPSAANKVGTTGTTSFTENGLPAGTYYYQVQARDAYGNVGPFSAETSVVVEADTTPPTAPANLTATGVNANVVNLSWNPSTDNVGVTSYEITRNGAVIGTSATPSYTDNTTTANTEYTYTVTALDANGNRSTASNEATLTTPVTAPPLALGNVVNFSQTAASTTMSIGGVTTTGPNELLVAFLTSDGPSGSGSQSFSTLTGGGLTWTLRKRVNTQAGTSEIWTAAAASPITNATVTATRSGSYVGSISVASFKNADLSAIGATGGANATTGASSVALTTTRNGSWVWGVGNDWDGATTRTVGSGQVKVFEYLAAVGDTFWVQRQTDAANTAGSVVTLNNPTPTNHRWNMAAIEILPTVP